MARLAVRPPIILASASPRRAELLRAAGIRFQVIVSLAHEPERKPAGIPVELWPICLAWMKAIAVQTQIKNQKSKIKNAIILAADTIVVEGSRILNKAADHSHARRMLLSLQGKTHRVITGIALIQGDRLRLGSATAVCRMKHFSLALLESYLASGLWKGKAGAYGIQDDHDPFVELIEGDFTTVVGLPMRLVQSELASFQRN